MTFTDRVRAIETKFAKRMPVFKTALYALGPRLYRQFCIREAADQIAIEIKRANKIGRASCRERV